MKAFNIAVSVFLIIGCLHSDESSYVQEPDITPGLYQSSIDTSNVFLFKSDGTFFRWYLLSSGNTHVNNRGKWIRKIEKREINGPRTTEYEILGESIYFFEAEKRIKKSNSTTWSEWKTILGETFFLKDVTSQAIKLSFSIPVENIHGDIIKYEHTWIEYNRIGDENATYIQN